ncbi:MAG: LysR family transcriptional regulator, partial [Gammaproteobacteria bacterium]|nr:LysR family transcriptional regulator [Gammaproteobacteria bacterium]
MHKLDNNRIDLNLLRVLHVLIEERNVSRAAARLHLSQSATSHALARLRSHFDDPLLSRTPRGMQLTSRAEALAPSVARILQEVAVLADIGAQRSFSPADARGRVRMAVMPTVAIALLPPLMSRLASSAPHLRIELSHWTVASPADLVAGRIDLAVGPRVTEREGRLRIEPLLTDTWVCVVRRGHPAIERGLTQAEYESWPHVRLDSA